MHVLHRVGGPRAAKDRAASSGKAFRPTASSETARMTCNGAGYGRPSVFDNVGLSAPAKGSGSAVGALSLVREGGPGACLPRHGRCSLISGVQNAEIAPEGHCAREIIYCATPDNKKYKSKTIIIWMMH